MNKPQEFNLVYIDKPAMPSAEESLAAVIAQLNAQGASGWSLVMLYPLWDRGLYAIFQREA